MKRSTESRESLQSLIVTAMKELNGDKNIIRISSIARYVYQRGYDMSSRIIKDQFEKKVKDNMGHAIIYGKEQENNTIIIPVRKPTLFDVTKKSRILGYKIVASESKEEAKENAKIMLEELTYKKDQRDSRQTSLSDLLSLAKQKGLISKDDILYLLESNGFNEDDLEEDDLEENV